MGSSSLIDALVVGADSVIGSALATELAAAGHNVVGTTRRSAPHSPHALRLDLSEPPSKWRLPDAVQIAYVCAAANSIDQCESDPAGTARLNVEATFELATRLAARRTRVVFLSSGRVFDGRSPRMSPTAKPDPVTEYGRQKATVERALLNAGAGHCVVRLTRVVAGWRLLDQWRETLIDGGVVEACDDMAVAPVPLSVVVRGLVRLAERPMTGVFHLSGTQDASYSDVARALARQVGVGNDRIAGKTAAQLGIAPWLPMRFAALDTRESARQLGLSFPELADCLL